MPTEIRMPPLSAGAEDAQLLNWLRKEGDAVRKGEEIAEVETDKATVAIEAPHDGIISSILVPAGGPPTRINSPIAVLLRKGELHSELPVRDTAKAETGRGDDKVPILIPRSHANPGSRVPASPLARRLAKDRRIELAAIEGTGPHGRIVRADVERPTRTNPGARAEAAANELQPSALFPASGAKRPNPIGQAFSDREVEEVPLDGMRRTIAERLTRSKQTVPHYYLRRDIRIDALLRLRGEINGQLAATGVKLSLNDFFIKACALALQDVPEGNRVWADDRLLQFKASDIGVAVSVDGGLYTPVLRGAHAKSISTISREVRQFVQRARDRKLLPSEYEGGAMTISNLGMHDVESFDAIINTPQAAILAVGASTRRMVFDDAADCFVGANVVSVALSVDHRVLDGVLGARLLSVIAQYILNPLAMIA